MCSDLRPGGEWNTNSQYTVLYQTSSTIINFHKDIVSTLRAPMQRPVFVVVASCSGLRVLSVSTLSIYPLSRAMLCRVLWNAVEFNYMEAEASDKVHSCFNQPTAGHWALQSPHCGPPGQRAMSLTVTTKGGAQWHRKTCCRHTSGQLKEKL